MFPSFFPSWSLALWTQGNVGFLWLSNMITWSFIHSFSNLFCAFIFLFSFLYFVPLSLPHLSAFPYNTGIFVTSNWFFSFLHINPCTTTTQAHTHLCTHIYWHTSHVCPNLHHLHSYCLQSQLFMPIFTKKMHIQVYAGSFFFQ